MTEDTYETESHEVKADTSKEAVWLIMKRDLYYMPEGKGYTGVKKDAGRFPLEETAVRFPDCDDHGLSFIHEDDAPEFSKACFEDIARKVLSDERDALAAENQRLREALLVYADPCDATETKPCGYEGNMCCMTARAALKGDKTCMKRD